MPEFQQIYGTLDCLSWAWRQELRTPLQKLALIVLANDALDHVTVATDEKLNKWAAECCCGVSAFRATLYELRQVGLIRYDREAVQLMMENVPQ